MSTTKHYLDLVGLQSYDSKLKAYIQEKVTGHLLFELVTANESGLPIVTSPKDNIIYLVPDSQSDNNVKREFMWINGAWELVGRTDVSFDGYVRTEDLDLYVTKEAHEDFEDELDDHEGRIAALEGEVESIKEEIGTLATKEEISEMVTTGRLATEVETINQALEGKASVDSLNTTNTNVTNNANAITALQEALSKKAASVHTHAISDVTGLQDALDSKLDEADFTNHGHEIADVDGLQDALDAKLAVDATITETEIEALFGNPNQEPD
jgi:hypothetical protein